MAWLTSLPGVGIKTASLVLLFNFHKATMPVDTHVHRVSQRIGLIGPRVTPEQAHRELLLLLPRDPDIYWNFHIAMITHGRRICTWANPKCDRCIVNDVCNYGRARLAAQAKRGDGA